jgi:hypothetical protein
MGFLCRLVEMIYRTFILWFRSETIVLITVYPPKRDDLRSCVCSVLGLL